jgi:GntR family transcriptional regulator
LPALFSLAPRSGAIYQQIVEQIRRYIALGVLRAGDQLPTAKQLALDLTINPNTVVRAYRDLEREELIKSIAGRGTFVRDETARHAARSSLAGAVRSSLNKIVREASSIGMTSDEVNDMVARAINLCYKPARTSAGKKKIV